MFGAAVNLAARVAAHAAGGQASATEKVAETARKLGLSTANLGRHQFRNVAEPVALFEARIHRPNTDRVIDPVCRMSITRASAAGRLSYADQDWWFCSLDCAGRFSQTIWHNDALTAESHHCVMRPTLTVTTSFDSGQPPVVTLL